MAQAKIHHVEMLDIDDSGIMTEVAVVKRDDEGNVWYINTEILHPIDKARLKKIVTGQHADKYPLWDLLSQGRLSNGINALDYFHYNFVKCKRAPGSKSTMTGLSGISASQAAASDKMIGSEFVDPNQADSDNTHGSVTSRGL